MYERLECLLQRYTQIKESNEMLKQKQAKSVAVTSKGDSVERTVISRSKTQQPKAHLQAIHTHSSGSNQQSSLPNLSIHQLRAILQENQHLIQSNDFSSPLSIIPNPFGIYLLSFYLSFFLFYFHFNTHYEFASDFSLTLPHSFAAPFSFLSVFSLPLS